MAKTIVGRENEQEILSGALASNRAELLAVYGRRRIGKTFLIRNFFEPRAGTYFEVTGTKDGSAEIQRRRFRETIERTFLGGHPIPTFQSWDDALSYLADLVERRAKARPGETIVLFFDELPWLATPRSGLLESLDYHWNRRLSKVAQAKVILCGSAASWMLRRIVRSKGGLHNRLTHRIRLDPFSLKEARDMLSKQRVRMQTVELLELYMAVGGVPYYLQLVPRGRSVAEVVGQLCFERGGALQTEFDDVFASLFSSHEDHIAILRALASRKAGLTRNELIATTGLSSGGSLNRLLQELEEAGFIARVEPLLAKVKNSLYRVIDEFTLFHLKWIERAPKGVLARGGTSHWRSTAQTPAYRAWTGYAFESLCLRHARELAAALDIDNLVTGVGAWRFVPTARSTTKQGAQVDLLFDRRDGVMNLCEIKFCPEPYVVTKAYAKELKDKVTLFERHSRTRKRIVITLVAPRGLKPNAWSEDLIERVVDGEALFR